MQKISHLFKGIWSLEDFGKKDSEINEIYARAIENPEDFVLKPQKEGGGNNFYGAAVKEKLLLIEAEPELKTYLIMEKINPPLIKAFHVRNGQLSVKESLSELGIFSVVFTKNQKGSSNKNQVLENTTLGTLFRTKASDMNEGGLFSGEAVVDQPFLIPLQELEVKSKHL